MLAFYRGFSLGVAFHDEQRQAPRWQRWWQRWRPGRRKQPQLATARIAAGAVVDAV